jgi:protein TonB
MAMNVVRNLAVVLLLAGLLRGFAMQDQSTSPTPTPSPSPTASASPTPSVAKPKKVRVSSGVAEGMKIHDVQPVYPRDARVNHITGDVVLQATIDRQGNIQDLRPVSGDPILVKSAVKAVSKWKYRPYVLNGEVVEVETQITVRYHM